MNGHGQHWFGFLDPDPCCTDLVKKVHPLSGRFGAFPFALAFLMRNTPPPGRARAEGEEMSKRPLIASPAWTPEEDDRLRTAAESGESIAAISKRLCRSEGALRHRARSLGIVLRRVEKNNVVELGLKAKGK
jgi:hypothetical protein